MSEENFQRWLHATNQEVLYRWFTTGLTYGGNDISQPVDKAHVNQIGERLARACLGVETPEAREQFWRAFPFYETDRQLGGHELSSYTREDRLNILNAALGVPEFETWMRSELDEARSTLLLKAWINLGSDINCLDEAWSHRSEKGDRPHLARVSTDLYLEQNPPGQEGSERAWQRWMMCAPKHEATRHIIEERASLQRKEQLEQIVVECEARSTRKPRSM